MTRIQELLLPTPQLKALHLARRERMLSTQVCANCGGRCEQILKGLELALGLYHEDEEDGEQ